MATHQRWLACGSGADEHDDCGVFVYWHSWIGRFDFNQNKIGESMKRDELLTDMAMDRVFVPNHQCWDEILITYSGETFTFAEYDKRRIELINCPPDSEAPSWAKWKAQGENGVWYWSASKPFITSTGIATQEHIERSGYKGKLPYGHDWRTTLTEIQHMEKPHEADARRLDALFEADMSAVKPSHYRAGKVECIEALASATINKRGIESICTANVIKYLWRYEQKNGVEDVRKAQWYLNRLLEELEK